MHVADIPLQMIVASTEDGGIGYQGKLPWPHNATDFKHFRDVTKGSVVVMGRRTYQEIKEIKDSRASSTNELLPGRKSVVVSTTLADFTIGEIYVERTSLAAVKCNYDEKRNLFVIGGKALYTELLPYVKTIHWTIFQEQYQCDTFLDKEAILQDFQIVDRREADGLYFLRCDRIEHPV